MQRNVISEKQMYKVACGRNIQVHNAIKLYKSICTMLLSTNAGKTHSEFEYEYEYMKQPSVP